MEKQERKILSICHLFDKHLSLFIILLLSIYPLCLGHPLVIHLLTLHFLRFISSACLVIILYFPAAKGL